MDLIVNSRPTKNHDMTRSTKFKMSISIAFDKGANLPIRIATPETLAIARLLGTIKKYVATPQIIVPIVIKIKSIIPVLLIFIAITL